MKKVIKKGTELRCEVQRKQHESCNMRLKQSLDPRKTAAIVNTMEKMIETRMWKVSRGLPCVNVECRVRGEQKETVGHLLARCKMLAPSKYIRGHNRALMILAVQWAKEYRLIDG